MKYVRRNFLCGLLGREPAGLSGLNVELRWWLAEVANRRVHGTTHEQVMARWGADHAAMHPINGLPPYPYMDDEQRKVARDAYVSWNGSRYSVPWRYAGKEVLGSRSWSLGRDPLQRRTHCGAYAREPAPSGRHTQTSPRRHSDPQP